MKIYENGQLRDLTPKELEDIKTFEDEQKKIPNKPTIEEQILALQNALISQKISGGGITTITDSSENHMKDFSLIGKSEQATTTGANLIPFPYTDRDVIKNGVTFEVKPDGGVRIYGKAVETVDFFLSMLDYGNDSIFNNSTGNGKILSGGKDGVEIEYHGTNKRLYLTIAKGKTVNTVIYPQLQNGSTATPYEPYTGGKPSPSPEYPQEIKNVGKWNELTGKYDIDASIGGNNLLKEQFSEFKITGDIAYIPLPKDHNNHKYTMLIWKKSNKVDTVGFTCGFYDHENMSDAYKTPCLVNGKLINQKGIVTSRQGVNHWVCFKPADEKFFDIYNVMYVEGEFKTLQYQPYIEPQTIKLSLEHPLRSIGNYKDEVTKDGIVRKIQRFECDGSENWFLHNDTSKERTQSFGIKIDTSCEGVNVGGMCNRFLPRYTVWIADNEGFDIYEKHTLYINIEKTKASTVEEFKTWISRNQVKIDAVLAKPVIEPLPDNLKQKLDFLKTYYPTTVISTDGGELDPDVEVTYVADTKNYVDQKIAAIGKTVVETQKALL